MSNWRKFMEPFKIKTVEPIRFTTREEREEILKKVYYNVFGIPADLITIDLLTDSGTNAMSSQQWAGIMQGDESYAGAKSFFRFEETVKKITGFKHIIPVHQGRAAERILFSLTCEKGKFVPSNSHFDTTRANIEFTGAVAVDLLIEEGTKPEVWHPFKGNMDVEKLEKFIEEKKPENIPLVMLTLTNNSNGGQPVSMENIRQVRRICDKYGIPLFFDACRFAENAIFIKKREKGYENKSIFEIVKEMFSYADGCTMSAKKDAFANIGGFLALNDDKLADRARELLIITEGFPTYGGLAGRDLEAIARGLEEVLDENYLEYRLKTVEYIVNSLLENEIPVLVPPGGHAVYIDAKRFLPHIKPEHYPGQSLTVELYRAGGIRGVELGSVAFGRKDPETGKFIPHKMELVRLALPRRVYTKSHFDYVIDVIKEIYSYRNKLRGYKIIWEAKFLRHFTARFEPIKT